MKKLVSLSLFSFLYFFQIDIINQSNGVELSIQLATTAYADSCEDSTADACVTPGESTGDNCRGRGCTSTGGGSANVGSGGGGSGSGGGGRSGGGGSGSGNTGNGDNSSDREGEEQGEDTSEEKCGNGKTKSQIHTAYISTVERINAVRAGVAAAIVLDTQAMRITLQRARWPKRLVDWATGLYSSSTGVSLYTVAGITLQRVKGEYEDALATCS